MKTSKLRVIIFAALGTTALAIILWLNKSALEKTMSARIESMPMRSVCIGRFVMDVPQQAVVTYRSASVAGWDIFVTQESDEEFILRLKEKETQLVLQKNERGGGSLENIRTINRNEVAGKIFLFDRKWIELMRGGKEVVSQKVDIAALVRSSGISYEFTSELRRAEDIDQLEEILNKLRSVSNTHIPDDAGFCFDRGFIADPLTAEQHEHTSLFLGIKEHPDLAVSLSTSAGISVGRTLLQRDAANDIQQEYRASFHRLRAGARSLNGIPGEEVLQRVHELNGAMLHGFMWESLTDKSDVYRPSLILELDTGLGRPGKPVNSSLSDAEALALWDKISSSLRLRPAARTSPTSDVNRGH